MMQIAAMAACVVIVIGSLLCVRMAHRDLGGRITALAADLDALRRRLSVQLGGVFTHPPPISQDSNANVALEATPPAADAAAGGQAVAATGLYDRGDSSGSEPVAGEPDPIAHTARDNGTPFPDLTAHRVKRVSASPAPADGQPK